MHYLCESGTGSFGHKPCLAPGCSPTRRHRCGAASPTGSLVEATRVVCEVWVLGFVCYGTQIFVDLGGPSKIHHLPTTPSSGLGCRSAHASERVHRGGRQVLRTRTTDRPYRESALSHILRNDDGQCPPAFPGPDHTKNHHVMSHTPVTQESSRAIQYCL